jgi:phosphopantothenoylcysteine decarboxylase/phosphopantothenate--cysteine ligase
MNDNMYNNPITQENILKLKERGFVFIEPSYGRLASGKSGKGRLPDTSEILDAVRYVLARSGDFAGKQVVVTAGGTREAIDPLRLIGNRSSGKMGFA